MSKSQLAEIATPWLLTFTGGIAYIEKMVPAVVVIALITASLLLHGHQLKKTLKG